MDSKGVIQLNIEIDYDKMITEENIKALYEFTGAKTAEDIAKVHMSHLGELLNKVVKDMPMIRYNIAGNFIPIQSQQANQEMSNIDKEHSENEQGDRSVTEVDEAEAEGEGDRDPIIMLDDALEHVSMNLGMPRLIKINKHMQGYLSRVNNSKSSDETISKYNGFDISLEGMDDLFLIGYTSYLDNELLYYSSNDGV